MSFSKNNGFQIIKKNRMLSNKIGNCHNPEATIATHSSRSYGRSPFLTQFEKMQKTKALWRNIRPIQKLQKPKSQVGSICSIKDLNKMKIKYRMEILKRKSRQQIFQQNMSMILKLEETPPKVDTWNYSKLKRNSKSSDAALEVLEKNIQLIKKIEEIQPKVQNWNYYKSKKSPKAIERTEQKFKIFQENMKIVQRVESVPPKVQAWSFKKLKRDERLARERLEKQEKLFEQNMKIIEKVESIPPKVQSWADLNILKKKAKRNSIETKINSLKKLEQLKKIIEQNQDKFKQKQQRSSLNQNRRYKTLPNKLPRRTEIQNEQSKKLGIKLLSRIQNTKCSINCWSKPMSMKLKNPLGNKYPATSGILSRIKEQQHMKTAQINRQRLLKI